MIGCEKNPVGHPYFSSALGASAIYKIDKLTTDGNEEIRHGWTNISVKRSKSRALVTRKSLNGRYYSYLLSEKGIYLAQGFTDIIPNGLRETDFLMPSSLKLGDTWPTKIHTTTLQTSQSPWESTLKPLIIIPIVNRVISLDEDISVSNKQYKKCILIQGDGKKTVPLEHFIGDLEVRVLSKTWYSADIGIVKREVHEFTDSAIIKSGRTTMTLLSYVE